MSWWASVFIALLSGIAGVFCAGGIASLCVKWYRISSFEGKSGYFVIFTALQGGVFSAIAGLVLSRYAPAWGATGFWSGLGSALLALILLSLAVILLCRRGAHIPPTLDGRPLLLEVEMRLPARSPLWPVPADGRSSFTLSCVVRHVQRKALEGTIHFEDCRMEGDRPVIPAIAPLFTRQGLRCITMLLGGKDAGGFIIPLPGKPGRSHESWSEWLPRGLPGKPWPETNSSYRFRVSRIPLHKPQP